MLDLATVSRSRVLVVYVQFYSINERKIRHYYVLTFMHLYECLNFGEYLNYGVIN